MELETRIKKIFNLLKFDGSALPPPSIMKEKLSKLAPKKGSPAEVPANNNIIKLFATASVEMWLRSVHSFLISSSLTNVSPLWASIAGYYSSHYTIRAIAHLLGLYQLRTKQYTVILQPSSSGFICHFSQRKTREHLFYWREVKKDKNFINENLFTDNPENDDISDAAHRNFATYIDHLNNFPNFNPLNYDELKQRIERISKMEILSYHIPDKTKYPDLEAVQIVAYHRIVYYRELLNEILGNSNRFWTVHRNPSWCRDIINFQRVKSRLIDSIG